MVMAQSLFITLKRRHPSCRIEVLAPAWTFSLLERMAEVDDAIAMPLVHGQLDLRMRYRLGKALRGVYDTAIVLPNSWKSALVPFFARIPERIGYVGEARWGVLNDARRLDEKKTPMTVHRFLALGLERSAALPPEVPLPKLSIKAGDIAALREKFQIDVASKILGLCPGAEYGPAKRWPSGYYAAVARRKIEQGWQVWLFGSEKDRPVAEEINAGTQHACLDFCGRTSLAEAVDLISLTAAVVSNDSGLMHVACALDKKLVAIYGSSDPGFTPPLSPRAKVVSLRLSCSPCFRRECPLGHYDCLKIPPERVLAELEEG